MSLSDLAPKLSAISESKMDRRVFVRGDKGVNYGRVMETMAAITQGGFTKVALLAEQTGGPAAAAASPGLPAPVVANPTRR